MLFLPRRLKVKKRLRWISSVSSLLSAIIIVVSVPTHVLEGSALPSRDRRRTCLLHEHVSIVCERCVVKERNIKKWEMKGEERERSWRLEAGIGRVKCRLSGGRRRDV